MAMKTKVLIAAGAIILLIGIWFFTLSGKKVGIMIKSGDSAAKVADVLIENKILKFKRPFLIWVKLTNSSGKIQAGYYEFSQRDNAFSALSTLRKGSKSYIRITIPEGSNIKQIAAIVKGKLENIDEAKFIKLANDKKLEGYLMPETYFVSYSFNEEDVIKMMHNEFEKKITPDLYERAAAIGMPMKDVIILASIVEKEAMKPEERAEIAGVFRNRLKKGIRLESCATVLYAMGVTKAQLSIAETKYPSPYNTYIHYGLPPGPICNPGLEAIKAVLYSVDTENLFFVAEGGGGHLFSKNLEQHVKNKVEAKAKQKERKDAAEKSVKKTKTTKNTVNKKASEEATRSLDAMQIPPKPAVPKKTDAQRKK